MLTQQQVNKMTPSDIKYHCREDSFFFTRKTMKFFGDTMANFGAYTEDGQRILYRKKPVKHGGVGSWIVNITDEGLELRSYSTTR